jgi:catechol 2,3-dioxygenase-like lactoylglutathione lyase family enzyme
MQGIVSFALATMTLATAAAAHSTGPGQPQGAPPSIALKFDNVRLLVTRFDETYAFYRDVLGLKPTWGKPGENYASFAFSGGAQIAIFRRSLMADAVGTAAKPSTRTEQDTAALVIAAEDVDALYAKLKGSGVEFTGAPVDQPAWGIRAAHFRDPDGNLLEVFSPLKK